MLHLSGKRKLITTIIVAGGVSLSTFHEARADALSMMSGVSLKVEPIIGYERVQKFVPTLHSKERLLYGARATGGIPLISLEAEYTQSSDTESFSSPTLTVKDTDEKLKLGLQSRYPLNPFISVTGRGGGQAKRNTHVETSDSGSTTSSDPITYRPYLGFLINADLPGKLNLSAGLTAVFNQFPDMSQNEYQSTFGFGVRLP
jgi:hypothetical protein